MKLLNRFSGVKTHVVFLLVLTVTINFLTAVSTYSAEATFSWTANSEPVAGYRIYYGFSKRNYEYFLAVSSSPDADGRVYASIDGLQEGRTYYFSVTAYEGSKESSYSDEVVYDVPGNYVPANHGDPAESQNDMLILEAGDVSVSHEAVRVDLKNSYINPVVIANTVTRKGADPIVVKITEVTSDGFTIQLQEHDYSDNIHGTEIVNYVVIEEGSYILDDGTQFEAGLFDADSGWSQISLVNSFPATPVVLTSLNGKNEPEAAIGRIDNVSPHGFDYKIQEQELNRQNHGQEKVGYLAWSPGTATVDGMLFQAGITGSNVNDKISLITLESQFTDTPYHFAGMQTTNGADPSIITIDQAGIDSMEIRVEEETSKDQEIQHTVESAGFLAIYIM